MIDRSEPGEDLSPTKRALLALKQMQSKLEALEKARNEPIAIVGVGCRFPQTGDRSEDFWQMLIDGKSGITEVAADRWDIDAYYDLDANAPGKMYARYGGFVPHLQDFDAAIVLYFGLDWIEYICRYRLLVVSSGGKFSGF